MSTEPSTLEQTQRKFAKDLFNLTWALLEKPDRSTEDDDAMLDAAHASCHHWRQIGEPVHFARGQWQVSRVNAVLGRADAAAYHAQRCLEICEAAGLSAFDHAAAYEALARAAMVACDADKCQEYCDRAHKAAEGIHDAEAKAMVLGDVKTISIPES